jgi:hypothetical protein
VKIENFSHDRKKLHCDYLLTPSGDKSKAIPTTHFLERKASKYSALKRELENIGGVHKAAEEPGSGIAIKGDADTKHSQILTLEQQGA